MDILIGIREILILFVLFAIPIIIYKRIVGLLTVQVCPKCGTYIRGKPQLKCPTCGVEFEKLSSEVQLRG